MPVRGKALTGSIAAALLWLPVAGHACSKIGFPGIRFEGEAHFIASARPDTVFAGAGSVSYRVAPGHAGPAGDRPIFGQVVSVERIGGLAAALLERPVTHVVLVPWDYGPDCTPTPWTRSARWIEPETRGLLVATLRNSSQWADGMPTFDVHAPEMHPYPQRAARQLRGRDVAADSLLSIAQLFELMEILPDQRVLADSVEAAVEPLFAWTRANPELARRYPATAALARARFEITHGRVRRIESPVVGTYRLKISVDGTERSFYARTQSRPMGPFELQPRGTTSADPTNVPRSDGYYLMVFGATDTADLPGRCEPERRIEKQGYLSVLNRPPLHTAAGEQWIGKLELELLPRVFADDRELGSFARSDFDRFSRRRRAGLPAETPARFTRSPDGVLKIRQEITLEDGRTLTILGERISTATVSCNR